jgi:hypothetical protein
MELDGGRVNVRRLPHGVWTVSLDFDLAKYPNARPGTVEHTPPTTAADKLDAMIDWACAEWDLRKGPAARHT